MGNPWLKIPLADYEGHMESPEVRQLKALADLFGEALAIRRPSSVAILGIAGGNGLDRIDAAVTRRVVGYDINAAYLDEVRRRFPQLVERGLELHCADLAQESLTEIDPVEMVHAALVFEHAGVERCLENALSLVAAAGGAFSVVLQLPGGESETGVSRTPFVSIQQLRDHFSFVDPEGLSKTLAGRAFELRHESTRRLAAGKRFWLGIFALRGLPT